jgi:hypothetical protein
LIIKGVAISLRHKRKKLSSEWRRLVSIILIALGAAGILPHAGNLPAMVVGGVVLGPVAAVMLALCIKNRQETPHLQVELVEQKQKRDLLSLISASTKIDARLLWWSINIQSLETFKAAIDKILTDLPNHTAILNTRDDTGRSLWRRWFQRF